MVTVMDDDRLAALREAIDPEERGRYGGSASGQSAMKPVRGEPGAGRGASGTRCRFQAGCRVPGIQRRRHRKERGCLLRESAPPELLHVYVRDWLKGKTGLDWVVTA